MRAAALYFIGLHKRAPAAADRAAAIDPHVYAVQHVRSSILGAMERDREAAGALGNS